VQIKEKARVFFHVGRAKIIHMTCAPNMTKQGSLLIPQYERQYGESIQKKKDHTPDPTTNVNNAMDFSFITTLSFSVTQLPAFYSPQPRDRIEIEGTWELPSNRSDQLQWGLSETYAHKTSAFSSKTMRRQKQENFQKGFFELNRRV